MRALFLTSYPLRDTQTNAFAPATPPMSTELRGSLDNILLDRSRYPATIADALRKSSKGVSRRRNVDGAPPPVSPISAFSPSANRCEPSVAPTRPITAPPLPNCSWMLGPAGTASSASDMGNQGQEKSKEMVPPLPSPPTRPKGGPVPGLLKALLLNGVKRGKPVRRDKEWVP